jgi:hypothetical protein
VQLSVSDVKYCQQRAQRKRPETRRIWYNEGARKRLEYVQQKIVSANNRTQKRYKQIKPIYLQKRRVYTDTFLTQATINLNK